MRDAFSAAGMGFLTQERNAMTETTMIQTDALQAANLFADGNAQSMEDHVSRRIAETEFLRDLRLVMMAVIQMGTGAHTTAGFNL